MTITNTTSVTLKILGRSLKPNETAEYPEMTNSTIRIFSEIGSCVITTQYDERSFSNSGNLVAEEVREVGKDGRMKIEISSIS